MRWIGHTLQWMARGLSARRPTLAGLSAGALLLAYMLLFAGSALAAPLPLSAPPRSVAAVGPPLALAQACDPTTTICIDFSWPLTFLSSIKDNGGKIMEAVGVIVALFSLGYGVRGKGWGKAGAGVVSGVAIAALAANIVAGGVQHQITGT